MAIDTGSWGRKALAGAALLACVATLWPFGMVVVWGGIVSIAFEPAMRHLSPRLGSRTLAALAMGLGIALALALPLGFAIASAADQIGVAVDWAQDIASRPLPSLPAWISALPVVGGWASQGWDAMAAQGAPAALAWGKAHAGEGASRAALFAGEAGGMAARALGSLVVAVALMAKAPSVAAWMGRLADKCVGEGSREWVELVVSAARGVAMGVCGTALALSVAVAAGLACAGIPAVSLLWLVAFVLCLAQVGPLPILAPAAVYMAAQGRYGAAAGLGVLALALSVVDGIMRPYLIGRQVKMSMPLIFAGVVGGLVSFGMVGLFVGPAALAVGSRILASWLGAPSAGADAGPDNGGPTRLP